MKPVPEERLNWSMRRVLAVAENTFREAVRMKLFLAMTALAILALAGSFLFREFNFGSSELKFIADFGFGGMTVFGSALAIIVTAQLFFGEIEHRTAMTLLAKPLYRSEFLLGKFLGTWATILCFLGMMTACLLLALWWRETSLMGVFPEQFEGGRRIVPYGHIACFAFLQAFRIAILSAAALLFASYATSALFAMVMGAMIWIVGQLQHVATEAWHTVDSWGLKAIYAVTSVALPNFHLFDVGDRLALGEGLEWTLYGQLFLYALLYSSFYLAIATASFNRREL